MKKEKKPKEKRKIKKFKVFQLLIIIALAIMFVINFLGMYKLNIIPFKYMALYVLVALFFILISILIFLKLKIKILNIIWTIIITILTLGLGVIYIYLDHTNNFMDTIKELQYKTENYNVIILKDKEYKEITELNNKNMEYMNSKDLNYDKAIEKLNKKVTTNIIEVNNYDALLNNLYNGKTEAILIEDSYLKIMEEAYPNINEKVKTLYTFKIKIKLKDISKEVKDNEPFNIYVSGLDTYGSIDYTSRSDVNMVITVNPKTNQVLLTSIPRDYYVQLKDTTGYKDKLTHAGIYGIESSVGTIENLFDIDINYYIKVNFSTVINLINAIGGVDVYNERSFTGHLYTYFKEGYVHLNGEQALEFARTRKTLPNGDNDRIKNQQAVIDGVIRKITSKDIITSYSSLLNSLSKSFTTNMSTDKITSLIKNQINTMKKWQIISSVVTGYDASEYTYSYPNQRLYVMLPNEESVNNAKDLINKVLNGEILDPSYNENASNVSNPTPGSAPSNVPAPAPSTPPNDNQNTLDDENTDEEIEDDSSNSDTDDNTNNNENEEPKEEIPPATEDNSDKSEEQDSQNQEP